MAERHPQPISQPELQEEHVGVSFAAEGAVARDVATICPTAPVLRAWILSPNAYFGLEPFIKHSTLHIRSS